MNLSSSALRFRKVLCAPSVARLVSESSLVCVPPFASSLSVISVHCPSFSRCASKKHQPKRERHHAQPIFQTPPHSAITPAVRPDKTSRPISHSVRVTSRASTNSYNMPSIVNSRPFLAYCNNAPLEITLVSAIDLCQTLLRPTRMNRPHLHKPPPLFSSSALQRRTLHLPQSHNGCTRGPIITPHRALHRRAQIWKQHFICKAVVRAHVYKLIAANPASPV